MEVLRLITRVLDRRGYDVIAALDGPKAIRACLERRGPIHMAVLDVMMPGMTGPELFACLRDRHPKIEVLFMSGYQGAQMLPNNLDNVHFLPKPFVVRELVQRVNSILGNEEICISENEDETVQQHKRSPE